MCPPSLPKPVFIDRGRGMGDKLLLDLQAAGLQKPPRRLRRKDVYMSDWVKVVVTAQRPIILKWDFHEYIRGRFRGFVNKLAGMFKVFDYVSENRKIVSSGDVLTIEQSSIEPFCPSKPYA